MTAYQELESTKYLTEEFEVEQQRISGQQNATEFWSLVAFYSTIVVVGFFLLEFVGVNVVDIFQPAVNAFVDWSINSQG